jgi:aminoglycoside N3'-acetyltransferase
MIDIAIMAVTLAIVMIVGMVIMPSYTYKKANSQNRDTEKKNQA